MQPTLIGARVGSAAVPAANLSSDVSLISTAFGPRDNLHPENLDRVAEYLSQTFRASRARVSEQTFSANGREYRNVVASYGPELGERIIVGAH